MLSPIPRSEHYMFLLNQSRQQRRLNSRQQVYARYNSKNLVVNVVNPLLPTDVDSEHDRSFLVSTRRRPTLEAPLLCADRRPRRRNVHHIALVPVFYSIFVLDLK